VADHPLSEEEQERRRLAIKDIMPKTPFIGGIGLVFDRYEHDDVTMRLPFKPELTNDGVVYHGGVVASAIDTAGALAAWSNHDFDKGARASTVSMTVQYIGGAKQSDLLLHARARKRGRELIFTDIEATDAEGNLVAQAVQTYRIV
jgi:uncharacterized protein (TIGR00369 family)